MSDLNMQLWNDVILDKLYEGFEQMKGLATEDTNALIKSGSRFRKIHIANAGANPNALSINDNTLKLDALKRVDTHVEYNVDQFTVGPTVIDRETILSTAYDNIASVVEGLGGEIKEGIAYTIRKNWYVDDYEIETSGTGTTATFGSAEVKKMTYADLMLAKRKLDAQKMPMTDRFVIISATHANDLLDDLFTKGYNVRFVEKDALSILDEKIAGFTIVQVPVCLFAEVSGSTIVPLNYNEDATDTSKLVEISLAFHKKYVSLAMDAPHVFYRENDPLYRGDVITMQAFAGGSPRSSDNLGIIPIVSAIV